MSGRKKENGMALIVTLLILAVLSIMAATFVTNMSLDNKISFNVNSEASARFIAKSGLNHAIAVLRQDADFINSDPTFEQKDWNTNNTSCVSDDWVSVFSGSDVDISDTVTRQSGQIAVNTKDAKWIYVHQKPASASSPVIGRYAVLIEDENAKININSAGNGFDAVENTQQGESTAEIDLGDLFDKIPSLASSISSDIVNYSKKPFAEIEEIYKIAGVDQTEFNSLSPYLTIYSSDHDLYYDNFHNPTGFSVKININYDTRIDVFRDNLFNHFSWNNPVKECLASINLMDYRDSDNIPSVFTETELNLDINGDGSQNSSTKVYGIEGIQVNEILSNAWVSIDSTNGSFITKETGNFVIGAQYAHGTSIDTTNMATARFQIPWDNGSFKVKVYSKNEPPTDSINCRVEGVGYDSVPAGGSKEFTITVSDGNITIELEDPLQVDAMGDPASPQIPSKFEKIEINAGDFIEIVNISRNQITITPSWKIVLDNGTPGNDADDKVYHVISDVTLNGASASTVTDPVKMSYSYLILTNSEKALDILFGSTVDGVWDGSGQIRIPVDASNSPTFNIRDSGDESATIKDGGDNVIDNISASSPNDYCVSAYNPGSLTDYTSREKVSPDYDIAIDGNNVWSNSTSAGNISGYFATPGAHNSSTDSYITVSDGLINNPYFIYDMPKNEFQNSPNNALAAAKNYLKVLDDMINFTVYSTNASQFYRKTNWSAITDGAYTFLALPSSSVTGSKITWKCDPANSNIPDGEYRIFIRAMQAGEIHKISGYHLDVSTGSVNAKDVSTTLNDRFYGCANGDYVKSDKFPLISDELKHRFDDLLPFTVSQNLLTLEDNCHASTPVTQNTILQIRLQPAGFSNVIDGRLNVNTACAYTLQTLPGIDFSLAQAIVSASESAPFGSVSDLLDVPGMNFSGFCKISNLVTVRSNNFKITVLGQRIVDANKNGSFDSTDKIIGTTKNISFVQREIKLDGNRAPSSIKILTKSSYWSEN